MSADPFPDMPEDAPGDLAPAPAVHGRWWRFDGSDPRIWAWTPFPEPLHRFDPLSGRFRVRYVASSLAGAVMERFGSYGRRRATASDGDTVVARLLGRPAAVDLIDPDTRRALNVDERISVGRAVPTRPDAHDPFLDACGRLADRVHDWFGLPPAAIAFRSRHATDRTNLAFGRDTLDVLDTPRTLAEDREVIAALLAAGVTVPERWLDDLDRTDPR